MLKKVAMIAVVLGLAAPAMANEEVSKDKTEEAAPHKTKEAKKSKSKNKKKNSAAATQATEKAAPAEAAPSDADMDAPAAP